MASAASAVVRVKGKGKGKGERGSWNRDGNRSEVAVAWTRPARPYPGGSGSGRLRQSARMGCSQGSESKFQERKAGKEEEQANKVYMTFQDMAKSKKRFTLQDYFEMTTDSLEKEMTGWKSHIPGVKSAMLSRM